MKSFYSTSLLLLLFLFSCQPKDNPNTEIRINQLGYYPKSVKKAVVVNAENEKFEIRKTDGTDVYAGLLSDAKHWDKSDESVKIADFSKLTEEGTYTLTVGESISYPFEIKANLYADAFKAAIKSYYYARASMDLDEEHAGKWKRAGGHPDTLCYFHPSAKREEKTTSSPKGWYDAGDHNKYMVNGGVTVGTLLNFYELLPNALPDASLNLPESGNSIPDILDEVKYELDWALTMQAPDGASHFKLTSKGFTSFIMPEQDTTSRFVVGKATASTLNLAAMTAQASRLYAQYDSAFANQCKEAAKKAWAWAKANPDVVFKNPKDVQTGEYGDSSFVEEFWWAAAELYLATKDQEYKDFIMSNQPYVDMQVGESWRGFLGNIGSFSLLLADSTVAPELKTSIEQKLISLADNLLQKQNSIPYRIAIDDFQWGSSSDVLNSAVIFAYAFQLKKDQKYLDAIIETTDYIFGKNATGYSFMTGFGDKLPMHIHNRTAGGDGVDDPMPGYIAGGPNYSRQDDIEKAPYGAKYPHKEPAKSYVDDQASYASNETCINWNAPAVFVLGFLEANTDKLQ